jgi:hypothetical protein
MACPNPGNEWIVQPAGKIVNAGAHIVFILGKKPCTSQPCLFPPMKDIWNYLDWLFKKRPYE